MRAYYYDNLPGDQRLPHDCVPSRNVSDATLNSINVTYWQIPVEGYEPKIDAIAKERKYKNRDTINVSKAAMGDVSSIVFLCFEPVRGNATDL
jgi:1,2-dihydroxy-3-keto-5-methylthiopentene dioxygenase